MMQVGTNQSTTYHSQPSLSTSGGQTGRSSSTSRQQQQQPSQYDNEQLTNIRPRLCVLRKWPHYDGYGVHLARNQHWLGLRIGDVEPNSPAESGGLLREDVVLSVNGHSVENDDFFVILSFIQHELEDDQIRFLVLDPHSADLARRQHLNIDENYRTCVRMETPTLTVSPEKLLYDQWRSTNNIDPTAGQNTINLGPTLNQNPSNINNERYQKRPPPPRDGRDDVYTFLPYSDHAIENGKSFFDVLFDQSDASPSTQEKRPHESIHHPRTKDSTHEHDDDNDENKTKSRGSHVKDDVKNFVKTGLDTIKSVLPTLRHDSKDKPDQTDSKRKPSVEAIDDTPKSPSLLDKVKNKLRRSSSPTNTTDNTNQENQSDPNRRFWDTASEAEVAPNNNLRSEPRMCSLSLRPGIDTIGISLQSDKDFGHIIKHVEPNSFADRAGIEQNDVILSLNEKPLLNIPYEDVLSTLKKSRHESNLDFLVAKKSYLLKSNETNPTLGNIQHDKLGKYPGDKSKSVGEVMPSSNITERNNTSGVPPSQALEDLYNKYNKDQTNFNRPKETVSTTTTPNERYDNRSPQLDNDRYPSKQQQSQQQGQILQGVGPATADRSSWGASSGKSTNDLPPPPISADSSDRSTSRSRQPDTDDTNKRSGEFEDAYKPLQVGITNPTPTQQSGNISPNFPSGSDQRDHSPKSIPSPNATATSPRGDTTSSSSSSRQNQPASNIPPIPSTQTSSTKRDNDQGSSQTTPSTQSDARLGPSKPVSLPSKPIKTTAATTIYDDTDDDDLSDISERSREEDASDPVTNKNLQSTGNTLADNKRGKPYPEPQKTPTADVNTTNTTSGSAEQGNLNEKRPLTSKSSDADKQPNTSSPSTTAPIVKARRLEQSDSDDTTSDADKRPNASSSTTGPIVQARRLEQSDSEDTTSGADSQGAKRSAADSFYSPDESVDDEHENGDQRKKVLPQSGQKDINQATSSSDKKQDPATSSLDKKQDPATSSSDKKQDQFKSTIEQKNDKKTADNDDTESSNESSASESEILRTPTGKAVLATLPLSELKDHGYELHNIQLMQPTETSPVGLKLTKQQDPLQYIITAVAKGTKADLAGLRVNDWLIKIEDEDIRLVEFSEVSQDIRQLLTNAGLINMVIARKKTPTSSPTSTKQVDKQQITPSKPDSISRQQGAHVPGLLTTDITRDTPDSNQVRFTRDEPGSPSTGRSQTSPVSTREKNPSAPAGPLSVGITNQISGDNLSKVPRSESRSTSRSPTREHPIDPKQKLPSTGTTLGDIDPDEIRQIVLKEALGLDFNSFIPEGDSQIQTHFISNVQQASMADKAGLRDGDRILTVNGVDVTNSIHEDVRLMMQSKKPLQLTVVNDPKYLELIESVKRNQNKTEGTRDKTHSPPPPDYETVKQEMSGSSRDPTNRNRIQMKTSGSDSDVRNQKPDSPKSPGKDDLSKHLSVLFSDDQGSIQVKHCLLKKDPTYNGYGLLLRYQNGLHLIDQVEEDSPAYNSGLREDDVILYVDKKNVEQMTHDDVKILIRKLSLSNTPIDLILLKKSDVQRYKNYQDKNSIDWKPLLKDEPNKDTIQTEQQGSSNIRSSNDQTSVSPKSTSGSTGKQQAPAPPPTSLAPGTRICNLQPSAEHTAGFALSGSSSPPFVVCQIEKNSPAEKAGLLLNDAVLSINGKSVTEASYKETVALIKEALRQPNVELVVRDPSASQSQDQTKKGSQSTISDQTKGSMASGYSSTVETNNSIGGGEQGQSTNAVEEYQKQRNKELSYTLRLCHLHPTNGDGTQAATFGFELSEDPSFEYPLILRVEPQSSAEVAGLQSRDILLKINERKTKGLGYDKVKKEIDKGKRDGRLELLVVDQETFDYCKRTKKPLKEPEMKVKHIFPKSRSSASFHKLPVVAATATSRDHTEQFSNSSMKHDGNHPSHHRTSAVPHLSTSKETDSENEEDLIERKPSPIISSQAQSRSHSHPAVNFDLSMPSDTPAKASAQSHESPLKFFDPAQTAPQQTAASSTRGLSVPDISRSATAISQTSTKGSKTKVIPNAINNLFHKISHSKSSKPDYDAPPKTTIISKTRAPSPPTVRVGHNRLETRGVSQSLDTVTSITNAVPILSIHDTVRSTISTGSFDYLRGPRRCVLKVDRNKGLGFVLSATGDYDHTITAVEKYSAADIAGLQVNDEVLEVDGVNVRNVKYEQVVEMLVSAMRINDSIEMRVIDGHVHDVYPSTINGDKQTNGNSLLNSNNNNNNNNITATHTYSHRTTAVSGDDLSDINSSISPFDSLNQQKIATSYPNLPGQLRHLDNVTNRALSGSVPALSTGITASPNNIHLTKSISNSSEKGSVTRLSDISTQDAPVARLCRIRKFATSPFYGFFLCGDPKKLGRVFISDVTKHSPAAVCGLRDGDRVIEINGTTIDTLTYETILDKIKQHMARDDLELLVLDKKSVHWYRERNYPITSRTLPTIVHIEPIINDTTSETQFSDVPATHTKMVGFADRRVSKTGL